MSIRALLFDTGDTLWRYPQPPPAERAQAIAAGQVAELLRSWGRADVDAAALARDILAGARAAEREAATSLLSPDYRLTVQAAASFRGLSPAPAEIAALWRAVYVDPHALGRQPYPDAGTTLRWAKGSGYTIGVVANYAYGADLLAGELRAAGLGDLVDVIAVSSESGWLKPHARIFMDAVRRLGVRAEETALIGDSPEQDIRGGLVLGMTTILKRNGRALAAGERPAATPDYQIDDLWELRALAPLRRDGPANSPLSAPPSPGP